MDKETLFKRKASEAMTSVPIGDGHVMIRALSRDQVVSVRDDKTHAHLPVEYRLIAASLIDPVMTPEEVAEWLGDAPVGDCAAMERAVNELSGTGQGAGKSGVPGVHGQP